MADDKHSQSTGRCDNLLFHLPARAFYLQRGLFAIADHDE